MDQHVAVLARNGERDLAFEIEMLLAADAQPPFDALRARRERGGAVALAECVVGQHVLVGAPAHRRPMTHGVPIAVSTLASRAARRACVAGLAPRPRTRPGRGTRSARRRTPDRRRRPARRRSCPECPRRSAPRPRRAPRAPRRDPRRADCPRATGAPPTAMCSRPSGSRMSSMNVALPATCFGADHARIGAAHDAQPQFLGAAVRQRRHRPPP